MYFANDASYSVERYACKHKDGTKGLFVAEVATGNAYNTKERELKTHDLTSAPIDKQTMKEIIE